MSTCLGKNFLPACPCVLDFSSFGSWKYDLSGLWYVSEIIPSWYDEFFSNFKSILGPASVLLSILGDHKFSVGLEGGL